MKTVGLITEYNPFHNGHLHHLRESLRLAGAGVAVAVMSGHFLQRGEPALVDKWVRTAMAIGCGVDLVVELPFPFACNSAPHFARGAVQVLNALGGVESLCFGSESGRLHPLQACAELLLRREDEVAARTALLLKNGSSYPAARAAVVGEMAAAGEVDPAVLATPNNILGIEYLKALRQTGSPLLPLTLARSGAGYHDEAPVGAIASATGIRRMLAEDREVTEFLPGESARLLQEAMGTGRVLDPDLLHRLLLARLQEPQHLSRVYLVENGLENRLCQAALESSSWDELAESVNSRQFTRTRIQRTLIHLLHDSLQDEMAAFLRAGPLYLRVLGCTSRGRAFLAAGRQERTLPLVQNLSRGLPVLNRFHSRGTERARLARRMLEADLRATRIYTLLMKRWDGGNRNRDYFEEVVREVGR